MEPTPRLRNIFLSDDDSDDCSLFLEALEQVEESVCVRVAHDGVRLMQDLSESGIQSPELIFLDLNMPKKNGLECLAEIRTMPKYRDVPVVILSTTSNSDIIDRSFEAGANLYITKPASFGALKKSLAFVLSMGPMRLRQRKRETFVINQA